MALVLGIVGLAGALGSCCCCLFSVLGVCAPVGWYLGHKELAAIRAGQAHPAGEPSARAGMICGMIGTGFLVLYVVCVMGYVVLVGLGATLETLKHGPLHH
jgi:hypothetical protein